MCYHLRVNNINSRGMTIGGTLLAVTVLTALAMALASLCVTHIRASNRAESALRASNLARSTIAMGVAKVLDNQEFGLEQLPEETLTIENEYGTAFLSFHPTLAEDKGMMHSTNNSAGTTSVEGGEGRVVPANAVHLVARGYSGGVVRQVETVLSVPSFPWALAAEGEVVIREGAMVGSLPEGVWPPSLAELEPADLVSNSTSDTAIILGSGSRVLGDVETPGGVLLSDSTVQVDGQIRESAQPTSLPLMNMDDFDPIVQDLAYDDLTGLSGSGLTPRTGPGGVRRVAFTLSGAARHEGDFVVEQDITLDGGFLFVNGDLSVDGNLDGTGLLVVNGDLVVNSGVSLDGATKVAIVSSGQVTLKGAGPASSSIRGLFYAEDGLIAEQITVIGALIAAGPDAGIELVNSRALSQTVEALADLTAGGKPKPLTGPGGLRWYGYNSRLANSNGSNATSNPGSTDQGSLDASSFIPMKERVKVVSWFES